MTATLQVERDPQGLQMATRELFEEAFFAETTKDILKKVGDDEDARERILFDAPVRSLSPGYYNYSAYLLDLGASIEVGAQFTAAALLRDDVIGLQAIRRAKAEFERDHPSCQACGERQHSRFAPECRKCKYKLRSNN
jgi:hypothetical protein